MIRHVVVASTVYTQADLTAVTQAIMALATGTRVTSVTFEGPPRRTTEYAAADLPQLRALQAEIQREVNASPRFRRFGFSKGFDPGSSSSA